MKRAELRNIRKVFEVPSQGGGPATRFTALDGVSIDFLPGEVHALLGENGAGKSTLMHILSGLHRPTDGCIVIGGKDYCFASPRDALASGVAMVHQRPILSDELSVMDNILLGPTGLFLNRSRARASIETEARQWDINLDLESPVSTLDPAGRLRTALLAALHSKPDFLVLDEPTSALDPEEHEQFLSAMCDSRSRGLGVILITHRLGEVLRYADRVSVLRKGQIVFSSPVRTSTWEEPVTGELLTKLLDPTGSADAEAAANESAAATAHASPSTRLQSGAPVFSVSKLSARPSDRDAISEVSFTADEGSITGIFGMVGAGLSTLEDILSGMRKPDTGSITVGGVTIPAKKITPAALRKLGITVIPSDRTFRGSNPNLTIRDMLLSRRSDRLFPDAAADDTFVRYILRAEGIDASPARRVRNLSGGQIQRLMLARELAGVTAEKSARAPRVIICAEPEWGLDIASMARLRQRLTAAAASGTAVIVLTDDTESLSDTSFYTRTHILREGRLT
jgi:simple sugar transport system ATP-binding protein